MAQLKTKLVILTILYCRKFIKNLEKSTTTSKIEKQNANDSDMIKMLLNYVNLFILQ